MTWGDRPMLRRQMSRVLALALAVLVVGPQLDGPGFDASAQQPRRGRQVPVPPQAKPPDAVPKVVDGKPAEPEESVQADVSTRNVAVTSSFTGTEIVVFGAVDNSRQASPEAGLYDVVIVIEGVPSTVTVRKKDRVGGIWLNANSAKFTGVPSYYAIASTRPLDEVAPEATLIGYEIGFNQVRMDPETTQPRLPAAEIKAFREAVVRLKLKDGLYVSEAHGVAFIGKSLFRASIALPATVSVGPFDTRVYLFRGERLISQYNVRINLEREGLERVLHDFAFNKPFLYGLATVALALMAGMVASAIFSKSSH
jgi:uncharacterized protein (TIGR02186 family)